MLEVLKLVYNFCTRSFLNYIAWPTWKLSIHIFFVTLLRYTIPGDLRNKPRVKNALWRMFRGDTKIIFKYIAIRVGRLNEQKWAYILTKPKIYYKLCWFITAVWLSLVPYMLGLIFVHTFNLTCFLVSDYINEIKFFFTGDSIFYKYHDIFNLVKTTSWTLELFLLQKTKNKIKTFLIHFHLYKLSINKISTYKNYKPYTLHYKAVFWVLCQWVSIASIVGLVIFYSLYLLLFLNNLKQLAIWFLCLNLGLWLFSTFNFFIKRNRFGKFTSAIQRFWKRANNCFWIIELCLFILGFYYYLNASQEPLFMYDTAALSLHHFPDPTSSYWTLVLLGAIVYLGYLLSIQTTQLIYKQQLWILFILLGLIVSLLALETYQFYYLLSKVFEPKLNFDIDSNQWVIDYDSEKLRTKYHYFSFCLILKYWHFIFMSLSWIFFFTKSLELGRLRFALLGFNIQNTILIYFLSLAYQIYWLKWSLLKFLDNMFYYFFTNNDGFNFNDFLQEVLVLVL